MKKLLFILLFLPALVMGQGGVKISAMPPWTNVLDSVWFPIIDNNGILWTNYRAQGWQIGKERIDSIINNWPAEAGFYRFAVASEDDGATQTRDFDQSGNTFTIHGGTFTLGTGAYVAQSGVFTRNDFASGYNWFQADNGSGTYYSALFSLPGEQISLTAATGAGTSQLDLHSGEGIYISQSSGVVYVPNLANTTTSNVVYYNTSTGLLTYGAASGGGGGGSGIQSIEGNNGVTVLTDSIVQLGSATVGASTFTAVRHIDALTSYLHMTGTGTYTLRATTTNQRAIFGEATTNGIGVTGSSTTSGGVGVQGIADASSSVGVQGSSVSGIGVSGSSTSSIGVLASVSPSSTNTSVEGLRVIRSTSGTAANNIGTYISFHMEYSSPTTTDEAARIGATFTDVSVRTSDLNFTTKLSNSPTETMTLKGAGNLILNTTAKGYGLKSPDGTVWYITVSNAGVLSTSTTAP